jgi:hypothetical protein
VRMPDEEIVIAWCDAARDLHIKVEAPFTISGINGENITFEALILEFGGPKGTVVGTLSDSMHDARQESGYYFSNLAPAYRSYNRQLFIDTLNDWQWFGQSGQAPNWYTGDVWSA